MLIEALVDLAIEEKNVLRQLESRFDVRAPVGDLVEMDECDLADMHNAAWLDLQLCGYSGFYITRVDGQELTAEETGRLEQLVERDFFYDYAREELAVWFDSSRTPDCMYVDVTLIDDDPDN